MVLYLYPETFNITNQALPYYLLGLLALSEFSDMFDGWIARKLDQVTDLGKLLDPMADSIWRLSVFLTFTQPPVNLPMWVIFLFLFRDSAISTLRTICALRGFTLAARLTGKLKAVFQGIAAFSILSLMIPYSQGTLPQQDLTHWSTAISAVVGAWAMLSAVDYLVATKSFIKNFLACPAKT